MQTHIQKHVIIPMTCSVNRWMYIEVFVAIKFYRLIKHRVTRFRAS